MSLPAGENVIKDFLALILSYLPRHDGVNFDHDRAGLLEGNASAGHCEAWLCRLQHVCVVIEIKQLLRIDLGYVRPVLQGLRNYLKIALVLCGEPFYNQKDVRESS